MIKGKSMASACDILTIAITIGTLIKESLDD